MRESGTGWVYWFNECWEYSPDHPLDSGEKRTATEVRPATPAELQFVGELWRYSSIIIAAHQLEKFLWNNRDGTVHIVCSGEHGDLYAAAVTERLDYLHKAIHDEPEAPR